MLHYDIKTKNMELTDELRDFAGKKLANIEKLVESLDHPVHGWLELERTGEHEPAGEVFRAEVQLHVPGDTIRAESRQPDMYAAVRETRDKVERELKEYKDKYTDVKRRRARQVKERMRDFFSWRRGEE